MTNNPPEPAYIAGLATSLQHHPDALAAAEADLARIRAVVSRVATWINDPDHDPAARTALAQHLGLPAPRTTQDHKETSHG